jgi:hypothetical protein
MIKVFIMSVKHQSQGHKVKSVGTHRRVLSEEAQMYNIKVLVHNIQKLQPKLKFYTIRSVTKVTRSKFLVEMEIEMERSCHNEHLCKISKTNYLPIKKYSKVKVFNK